MFGTVETGNGWNSQVRPRAIGGITTCHKMRHNLSLPTVTYIFMRELPHFRYCPTSSFLHSQPIQTPPSGSGLICAIGQVFIWDDPSVTPLSWSFTKGVPLLYTHHVMRAYCCEVLVVFCWESCFRMEPCSLQGVGDGVDVCDQLVGGSDLRYWQHLSRQKCIK